MLIYSRLAFAWIMITISLIGFDNAELYVGILLVCGLLTDIFDGIIARYMNLSSAHLRQLDTKIDRLFWLSGMFSVMILFPSFFINHLLEISILLFLEFLAWLIGIMKFKNAISFHSLLSKFWAISILVTILDVLIDGHSGLSFQITFWYGILAQADIIVIAFILPEFQCDIPSSWHALRVRKGKSIRRLKLFNG